MCASQKFAEVLREMGLPARSGSFAEPADCLNLSLQGNKFLKPNRGSRAGARLKKRHVLRDRQGNCARISDAARHLSENSGMDAAWETKL